MTEEQKEIYNGVQSQIGSFDNKASVLISVVGIIFALSLSILDVFHSTFFEDRGCCFRNWYIFFFIAFIVVTFACIFSFAMVIWPRKNKCKEAKYPNYYRDITMMTQAELEASIKEYSEKSTLIVEQIKNNAAICNKKHRFVSLGMFLLIPFTILITVLIIMTVFA